MLGIEHATTQTARADTLNADTHDRHSHSVTRIHSPTVAANAVTLGTGNAFTSLPVPTHARTFEDLDR